MVLEAAVAQRVEVHKAGAVVTRAVLVVEPVAVAEQAVVVVERAVVVVASICLKWPVV